MKKYLSLVKFSHTIFALPFAMVGFFLAVVSEGKAIDWKIFLLIIGCMVFARSAAMAFNRLLDADIDVLNPRTATREIPAGSISSKNAIWFIILNVVGFMLCAYLIRPLCFYLSPIALMVILGYTYTKRFTFLCHFVLGLGLALAPIGAFIAFSGGVSITPILYGLVVLFWVAGFDVIYALQDEEFDKGLGLNSIPVKLGKKNALNLSILLHVFCVGCLLWATYEQKSLVSTHYFHYAGVIVFIAALIYQHRLVSPSDLSKVNLAFFTLNGIASVVFGTFAIIDMFV